MSYGEFASAGSNAAKYGIPPDQEAAVQQVAEALHDELGGCCVYGWRSCIQADFTRQQAEAAVAVVWPLVSIARRALGEARADGRREAAEAILMHRRAKEPTTVLGHALDIVDGGASERRLMQFCADLARGAQQPGKENPDGPR